MAVLRFRAALEAGEKKNETALGPAVTSEAISVELTEGDLPDASSRLLPAPTNDLAAKLAAADAAISGIEELLGKVRTIRDELHHAFVDLRRERDEWRVRAERHTTDRPWWRRLTG